MPQTPDVPDTAIVPMPVLPAQSVQSAVAPAPVTSAASEQTRATLYQLAPELAGGRVHITAAPNEVERFEKAGWTRAD